MPDLGQRSLAVLGCLIHAMETRMVEPRDRAGMSTTRSRGISGWCAVTATLKGPVGHSGSPRTDEDNLVRTPGKKDKPLR
jgi:hypothetical protein